MRNSSPLLPEHSRPCVTAVVIASCSPAPKEKRLLRAERYQDQVMAMPNGLVPTVMHAPAVFAATVMGVTQEDPPLPT